MSKVLLGIVAVLLAISYYLYSQNQILQSNNVALESAVATHEMERKINNGTKHIMEDIEKISTTVDGLDNGLQLQSTSN